MDETIIFPSSNWFHSSILAVSRDGWLMYGGISKSLCILEPLAATSEGIVEGNQEYQAHFLSKAHNDKIVTVDISPDWPSKRCLLSGSIDGTVKQWNLEQVEGTIKIKLSHTNDHHQHHKEEVAGVGYCNNEYAVSVGSFGHVVKWDLNSNVIKSFNNVLKNFKPTCISCSPHIHLNVAVGTKQGVVFVLDLNGAARVLYKVRGHDDEIVRVGWCPQYEVTIRKILKEIQARSVATERMKKIRQEPEDPELMKELDERVKKSANVEHFMKTHEATQSIPVEETPDSSHNPEKAGVSSKTSDETVNTSLNTDLEVQTKSMNISGVNADQNSQNESMNKSAAGKDLPEDSFDDTVTVFPEDDMFDIYKDHETDKFGHKKYQPENIVVKVKQETEEGDYMAECMKLKEEILQLPDSSHNPEKAGVSSKTSDEIVNTSLNTDLEVQTKSMNISGVNTDQNSQNESMNKSAAGKDLPEDSFDDTVTVFPEDDMFDIYKDHEADEFGHKKYQPENIVVKVKQETEEGDYMAECMKLKEEILQRKKEAAASIGDLVEALDKAALGKKKELENEDCEKDLEKDKTESSAHIHRHLLATVGKHGSVRIWSKTGKNVGSSMLPYVHKQKQQKNNTLWATLLWYKPDLLVLADGKSQLQQCNPLKIDCKNKFEFRVIHTLHKRGLYAIASNAPRVQTPEMLADTSHDDDWYIWTAAQDRNLIKYSLKENRAISTHNTVGGFVYMIETCPYDAGKIAIAVGDGAVRVWETGISDENETKLRAGKVDTYWQNVQGKVVSVAWHPTRENLLAFATGEARVGLIDVGGKSDKAAKVFQPVLNGGVYSICWGEDNDLYACASGELVVYDAGKVGDAPTPLKVEVEGSKWEPSAVRWDPRGLVVGSLNGGVAVLTHKKPHDVTAVAFVFNKMIHTIVWHPIETSSSNEESQYKNLIAVCSNDKVNTIVILEYTDKEDGTKQLSTLNTLSGHQMAVLQLAWNPHLEGTLLSTSLDCTVRVWNTSTGECTSVFGKHRAPAFGAAWAGAPQLAGAALSGGGDGCLRLWPPRRHPAAHFDENRFKEDLQTKKQKKKKDKKEAKDKNADENLSESEETGTAMLEAKVRSNKKFLLPLVEKQTNGCEANGLRIFLKKYVEKSGDGIHVEGAAVERDVDYLKLFGTINEINDLLDTEMERHQDMGNAESWAMLCIFRGHIDMVVQNAVKRDLLDTFLLSVAPSVSLKYWKDVMQLYIAQIDRLAAKSEDTRLSSNKQYGGPVYRKAAALLTLHDVMGAVNVLTEARLFKEAYVLCRTRYIDSVAEETLQKWAKFCYSTGNINMAALCNIALGNLTQATTILGKSTNEEILYLASDIAKVVGQTSFADHIEKKREEIKVKEAENIPDEILESLPTRSELECTKPDLKDLLKEIDTKMEQLLKDKANEGDVKENSCEDTEDIENNLSAANSVTEV